MSDNPAGKPPNACGLLIEGDGHTCPAGLPVPRGSLFTRRALRSVVILVLLVLAVTGVNLLWTAHAVNAYRSSQQQEQQEQQRQGALTEARLCTSFGRLAALRPPAGNPGTNPSRAFEQAEHAILVSLGTDLGCKQAGSHG